MVEWPWIFGIVLAVTAIQLLLYHQIQDEQPLDDQSSERRAERPSTPNVSERPDRSIFENRSETDVFGRPKAGNGRRCPSCGAINAADESYTYCYNCAQPLR